MQYKWHSNWVYFVTFAVSSEASVVFISTMVTSFDKSCHKTWLQDRKMQWRMALLSNLSHLNCGRWFTSLILITECDDSYPNLQDASWMTRLLFQSTLVLFNVYLSGQNLRFDIKCSRSTLWRHRSWGSGPISHTHRQAGSKCYQSVYEKWLFHWSSNWKGLSEML